MTSSTSEFGEADLDSEHFGGREPPRPAYPPDDRSTEGQGHTEHSQVFSLGALGAASEERPVDSIEAAVLAALERLAR